MTVTRGCDPRSRTVLLGIAAGSKLGDEMRYLPHTLCLMALRGRRSIHGRSLPSKSEAAEILRRLTKQDFGEDPKMWAEWIKTNRRSRYNSTPSAGRD